MKWSACAFRGSPRGDPTKEVLGPSASFRGSPRGDPLKEEKSWTYKWEIENEGSGHCTRPLPRTPRKRCSGRALLSGGSGPPRHLPTLVFHSEGAHGLMDSVLIFHMGVSVSCSRSIALRQIQPCELSLLRKAPDPMFLKGLEPVEERCVRQPSLFVNNLLVFFNGSSCIC